MCRGPSAVTIAAPAAGPARRIVAVCPICPPNRTKTFHVKQFCPIGAENLTRPHTSRKVRRVRSRENLVFLAVGGCAAARGLVLTHNGYPRD